MTKPAARPAPRRPWPTRWSWLALSCAVTVVLAAVFAPVLGSRALSLDDDDYITNNELVTRPSPAHALQFFREPLRPTTVGGYWMPLSMTSLMLDVAQGGSPTNLGPFHRTSLALHVVSTLALFGLLLLLFEAPIPALIGALAFGLHPLTVEPVAWVGERKTVLAGALTLIAAWAHVAWVRHGGIWRRAASWLAFALALLSKPTATPLPALLLLLDVWPLRRAGMRAFTEKWPLFVLAAVSTVLTLSSHAHSATLAVARDADLSRLPLQAAARLAFYAGKVVWPAPLSCLYPSLGDGAWSNLADVARLLAVVAVTAVAIVFVRRRPGLLTGWGWFVLTLAPVLGFFDYSWVTLSDKYTYLTLAGVAIGVTGACALGLRRTAAWRTGTLSIAVLMLLAEGTVARTTLAHWSDSLTLWNHIVRVAPNEAGARSGLGAALVREGRWDEARVQFERAAALDSTFWVAQVNVSMAALRDGDLGVAERAAARAVALMPRGADALLQATAVAQAAGRTQDAERFLRRALDVHPFDANARVTLAQVLESQGRLDESLAEVRRALQIRPGLPLAEYGLGHLLVVRDGFSPEARAHFEAALRGQPDWLPAMNELAWWLAAADDPALRDPAAALALATRASQLAGDTTAAVLDTRAVAEAAAGRFADAVATAERAVVFARRQDGDSGARVIAGRLELFRRGRPWLEAARSDAPGAPVRN